MTQQIWKEIMSGTLDQITIEIFLRCHTVTYHCAAHTEKAVDYVYEILRCDIFRHTFLTLHCTPTTAGEFSHFSSSMIKERIYFAGRQISRVIHRWWLVQEGATFCSMSPWSKPSLLNLTETTQSEIAQTGGERWKSAHSEKDRKSWKCGRARRRGVMWCVADIW